MKTGMGVRQLIQTGGQSLQNAQTAITTSSHNVSNAHKPGYSRQVANFETNPHLHVSHLNVGTGAHLASVSREHDLLLENQVRKETSFHSYHQSLTEGLERLEFFFDLENPLKLSDQFQNFFNSLRHLSHTPDELSARENVIREGETLASEFRNFHESLLTLKRDLNEKLSRDIELMNQMLKRIAELTREMRALGDHVDESGDLADQRDLLIRQLGELIPIHYFQTEDGALVILGPEDRVLVDRQNVASFQTRPDYNNPENISLELVGTSDTDRLKLDPFLLSEQEGALSALIQTRDVHLESLRGRLNELAAFFQESFNDLHAQGFGVGDFASSSGRLFFRAFQEGQEAAEQFALDPLVAQNPLAIGAAITREAPGDNVMVNELIKLQETPFVGAEGLTLSQAYERMGSEVALRTKQSRDLESVSQTVLAHLKAQREALAGVSLDEEMSQIIKMQHLFGVSSKVVQTADEMMQTVLSLK